MAIAAADDEIELDRIESQEEQSTMREKVNVRRNDKSADLEEERLQNERLRDAKNAAAQMTRVVQGTPSKD